MKKIYTTLLLACMGLTAFAQEGNDTTYVMLDFNANPWNYPVREVTKGWAPNYSDVEGVGSILEETDFSWPVAEASSEKVKVTVYPVDLSEFSKVSVYANYELDAAEAAALGITAGKTNMLYTQNGTTMRFEAPAGYQFGKLVFYTYRNSNFLVGDEYEEEYSYEYNGTVFPQKLKVWKPESPKKNQYEYPIWEGDSKNILFNYPYFSVVFVKVDIRLVPADATGIETVSRPALTPQTVTTLDGRTVKNDNLRKGIYIVDGKKVIR